MKERKFLGQSERFFRRIQSTISVDRRRSKRKNLEATLLLEDFLQAFDSIHRGKMEKIRQVYRLPSDNAAV